MLLFFVLFVLVGSFLLASVGGPITGAVFMTVLACLMSALTGSLFGIVILTNVFKVNYEVAFTRSFLAGAALAAVVVSVWTIIADLLAGGLTVSLVPHLWHASLCFGVAAFAVAVATMLTWAVAVFRQRKSKG